MYIYNSWLLWDLSIAFDILDSYWLLLLKYAAFDYHVLTVYIFDAEIAASQWQ